MTFPVNFLLALSRLGLVAKRKQAFMNQPSPNGKSFSSAPQEIPAPHLLIMRASSSGFICLPKAPATLLPITLNRASDSLVTAGFCSSICSCRGLKPQKEVAVRTFQPNVPSGGLQASHYNTMMGASPPLGELTNIGGADRNKASERGGKESRLLLGATSSCEPPTAQSLEAWSVGHQCAQDTGLR